MADTIPYILTMQVVLTASSAGTFTYPVPQNEQLRIKQLRFKSTGLFAITDIRDSTGKHFTNASQAIPIISELLQAGNSGNIGLQEFSVPMFFKNGTLLYIDFLDRSAAGNTVNAILEGERDLGI